jgi:osmotically-inducible protein OsmY
MSKLLLGIALLLAFEAQAQVNPLSVVARVVTTTMDVRTKAEVAADAEISAGISKRLLEDKKSEWTGVSALVFAQHVVLAGAVKGEDVKKRVEEVAKRDPKIKSLRNELRVGDVGKLVNDTKLDAEINAKLTAAKNVGSVNMRWKTTGGHTVLMGIAQSRDEAVAAVGTVRRVKGVKSVKSHLRVVAAKK